MNERPLKITTKLSNVPALLHEVIRFQRNNVEKILKNLNNSRFFFRFFKFSKSNKDRNGFPFQNYHFPFQIFRNPN